MAKKGEKRTGEAAAAAEQVMASLAPLGSGLTSKGMFGGYGIFLDGVMFGLVSSKGLYHLRVNDETRRQFEDKGGQPLGRMPYLSLPDGIRADPKESLAWAKQAATVAKAAKAAKKK